MTTEPTEAEKPKAKRMVVDPEVQAMVDIDRNLGALPPEAIARVLRWVNSKYREMLPVD